VLHGPGVVKVLMSTPDDMVLNHMDLRSVEVAIPSLRFWDLIGRDLDCCNREVSIEAIKHLEKSILKWLLKRQFWKFACPIWTGSVDRLRALFAKMKIEDLLLVRLRRISFCHHCPGRREWKDSKTSRACRLLPRESDTGAIAKAPYRLLPRDSSVAWVCLSEAGNLNKRIWVRPEKGRHNLLFVQNSQCQALF
jgi:hypothetical protein